MASTETNYPTSYNRELVLDLTLGAFYVYDFGHEDEDASAPRIHDYIPIGKLVKEAVELTVLDDDGDTVVDGSGNTVTVDGFITTNRTAETRREKFKFLCTQGTDITLAEYKDWDFTDWVSYDGTGFDFTSYLTTGRDLGGDMMRRKQAIYLVVYCERTEQIYNLVSGTVTPIRPSSCLITPRWDFAVTDAQGKIGSQFQAYRLFLPKATSPSSGDTFDYGPDVVITKNKLRGRGRALSLRFLAESGKDMILLGWGILGYRNDEP